MARKSKPPGRGRWSLGRFPRWLPPAALFALSLAAYFALNGGRSLASAAEPVIGPALAARSVVPDPGANACADCHSKEFADWSSSQHARAGRLVTAAQDGDAFSVSEALRRGSYATSFRKSGGSFLVTQVDASSASSQHVPEAAIGIDPLVQYLVPFPGGRLQALDASYDPHKREWFDVYGNENRQPDEWGYWKNRGMNWNSQCASCHMTGFKKNYDVKSDAYRSSWDAMGISCAQCHGPMPLHRASPKDPIARGERLALGAKIDVCASCHSRREELTGDFAPGERFNDHYRLALADQPGLYQPDGQLIGEDYEYGSLMMSRMGGHAGITCLDCHNPHSGKLKFPLERGNALCMSCHQAGTKGAPRIAAAAHSRHPAGKAGSLCVDCHMPQHVYMVRDLRRDHAFTSPDPLLTKELGIPNACNGCHKDKSADWALDVAGRWYGDKARRRPRLRARAINLARRGEPSAAAELLRLARSEDIPAWRAALTAMLAPWSDRTDVRDYLQACLRSEDALTRSAAARALANAPDRDALLGPMTRDASRLVRVDAERAAAATLDRRSKERAELLRYLDWNADQPVGALRQAEVAAAEKRFEDSAAWGAKLAAWDASSGASQEMYGRILAAAGRAADAEAPFRRAVELDDENPDHWFTLALYLAERRRLPETISALEKTVKLNPSFGRAWYNLGLAQAQARKPAEALTALRKAEEVMPGSPEPAYAEATLLLTGRNVEQARRALERALKASPTYEPARKLLSELGRRPQ